MTRFYKRPILLIEFDPNKSFSLQVSVPERSVTLVHFSYSLLYIAKSKNDLYFLQRSVLNQKHCKKYPEGATRRSVLRKLSQRHNKIARYAANYSKCFLI